MRQPIRLLLAALTLLMAPALGGCGKSPEAAANEVCDCMTKAAQAKDPTEMMAGSGKCQELAAKYGSKFSGEDQVKYGQATASCLLGGMRPH